MLNAVKHPYPSHGFLASLGMTMVFFLTACGGGGGAPASASPTTAATITVADEGKSFQVRVGQLVGVSLQASEGMDDWQLAAPDAAILEPAPNPGAAAAKGMTLRSFKAVAPGTAMISATDRMACNPGEACSRAIRAFRATVVVSA